MRKFGLGACPSCGSAETYASAPKTLWQKVSVLLLLRVVRCHSCWRRYYQPVFLPRRDSQAKQADR